MKKYHGFSLMEMIIALSIMTIVGGAVTPLAIEQIQSSRIAAASQEIRTLRDSIIQFTNDVKEPPNRRNSSTSNYYDYIYSTGEKPNEIEDKFYSKASKGNGYDKHLIENRKSYADWNNGWRKGWKGPYIDMDKADPWHRRYYISMAAWSLDKDTPTWIMSSGPNSNLEMEQDDTEIDEDYDDIAIRIK